PVNVLRNRKIWRTPGEIVKIVLRRDSESATFTKEGDEWKMEPPMDLPLNQDKVRSWVSAIQDIHAVDFAALSAGKDEVREFLLLKPSMTIDMTVKKDGQETPVHWDIGQDKGEDTFVHTSVKPEIYKLTKFSLRDVRVSLARML